MTGESDARREVVAERLAAVTDDEFAHLGGLLTHRAHEDEWVIVLQVGRCRTCRSIAEKLGFPRGEIKVVDP